MNNIPSSYSQLPPSIHIQEADDTSPVFEDDMLSIDMYNLLDGVSGDASLYTCSQGSQPECLSNAFSNVSSELDDMPEFSHLSTTNPMYLTGHGFALPYPLIQRENGIITSADGGLSPSSLGSSAPSPTSSYTSSLSPSSLSIALSDNESPVSPSPATPDHQCTWSIPVVNNQSSDSLLVGSFSNDSMLSLGPSVHRRSRSSPSARREPVASKAMLEANSRRRRHPAQFACPDCGQTFTAQFSLKRHQQSHTGQRPFGCSIPGCTQRFYNNSDCKRHEKSKKRHKDLPMQ